MLYVTFGADIINDDYDQENKNNKPQIRCTPLARHQLGEHCRKTANISRPTAV